VRFCLRFCPLELIPLVALRLLHLKDGFKTKPCYLRRKQFAPELGVSCVRVLLLLDRMSRADQRAGRYKTLENVPGTNVPGTTRSPKGRTGNFDPSRVKDLAYLKQSVPADFTVADLKIVLKEWGIEKLSNPKILKPHLVWAYEELFKGRQM
jgi:hypothetical protein